MQPEKRKTKKILNLYSGIGGNRKLWDGDIEVTAIENNKDIAAVYQEFFPKDKVVVGDAHIYLLENYENYDFIWSSPQCVSHSDIRRCGVQKGQYKALFPDMRLYEEIILLQHFFKGKWVVENVKPYYSPLIEPNAKLYRHYFWGNFNMGNFDKIDNRRHTEINGNSIVYGFDLRKYKIDNKRQILRNCVNPELGLHIFEQAMQCNDALIKKKEKVSFCKRLFEYEVLNDG